MQQWDSRLTTSRYAADIIILALLAEMIEDLHSEAEEAVIVPLKKSHSLNIINIKSESELKKSFLY